MDIILFRHGLAYDIGENGVKTDEERMLTSKGKKRTEKMCEVLASMNYKPDAIMSSPLTRAQETAKIISKELKFASEITLVDFLKPAFRQEHALVELKKIDEQVLVLVGHMPNLSFIGTSLISGRSSTDGIDIKKSGICCISFESTIKEGKGQLQWLLQPLQLKVMKSISI